MTKIKTKTILNMKYGIKTKQIIKNNLKVILLKIHKYIAIIKIKKKTKKIQYPKNLRKIKMKLYFRPMNKVFINKLLIIQNFYQLLNNKNLILMKNYFKTWIILSINYNFNLC